MSKTYVSLFGCVFGVVLLYTACKPPSSTQVPTTQPTMVGLWEVESVKEGDRQMTPIVRWLRLNKDFTQESGNGWVQHSYGSWRYDSLKNTVMMFDSNGVDEGGSPFEVSTLGQSMVWQRKENDQAVVIHWKRIQRLNMDPASKMVGLWDLSSASVAGEDQSASLDPNNKRYLFLRWDRQFRDRNGPKGNFAGVWSFHGHKPEITLWRSGEHCYKETWKVEVSKTTLTLRSIEGEDRVLVYERTNQFP